MHRHGHRSTARRPGVLGSASALVAGAALLTACVTAIEPQDGQSDPAQIARGEALASEWCAMCHAVGAGPPTERDAPSFAEIANRPGRDVATLRAFLDDDHFPMTTYRLFPLERDDVAAYIASLGTR